VAERQHPFLGTLAHELQHSFEGKTSNPTHGRSAMMTRDPVCGMQVNPNSSIKTSYNDQTYYFCHANCKHQFDQDPQRFTKQRPVPQPQQR
jgi:Cu+-exporting ATPase